jgi:iron(III) transport system substrate-binding protein
MRTSRTLALVACFVLVAVLVSGCGHKTRHAKTAVAADYSVTGTLTVNTSLPTATATRYLVEFKREYPKVKVALVSAPATQTVASIIANKKAPIADVVWHTPLSALYAAYEAKALMAYAYHPGQIDAVIPYCTDPNTPEKPIVTGTDARVIAFAVNPSKVGGASPPGFAELAESKYKGQIVMPSVNTDAGYNMIASLLSTMDESAWEYFDQLNANVAYYTTESTLAVDAVKAGTAGIAIGFDPEVVKAANGSSGAIHAVFPGLPDMSPYEVDADGLIATTTPTPAAKAFMEWAISDPAMELYAADTPITSVDQGKKLPAGYPAVVSDQLMQNEDFEFSASNRKRIVAEWMKRYGSKIKKK